MSDGPFDRRDIGRYLPLSGRPRVDESAVTSDWAPRLAELLDSVQNLVAGLEPEVASRPEVLAVRDRVASAAAAVVPGRRVKVAALGAVLVEALELAAVTGRPLAVDPVTSGAVALDRSLRAPMAIRAVIRDRTIRAVDADWEFGSGPVLAGTASAIVLFLAGRAGVPGA
jgi:hypothetical protein